MDKIFGRSNFVTTFIWRKVDSPNDNKISICPDHEFIHCYAKNIAVAAFNKMNSVDILSSYTNKDEKGRLYRDRLLRKNGKNSLREDRPTMWFPIVAPDGSKVWPIRADGKDGCWAYSIDGINNLISSNRLILVSNILKFLSLLFNSAGSFCAALIHAYRVLLEMPVSAVIVATGSPSMMKRCTTIAFSGCE